MSNKRWLIQATCTLGLTRVEWGTRLAMVLPPVNRYRAITEIQGYEATFHARNVAVHMALNNPPMNPETEEPAEVEYLMFYDDDILPRSRYAVQHLLTVLDQNLEMGVIGGVYPRRSEVPEPIVFEKVGEAASWVWEDGGVHRVDVIGTGFMMIRLAAIKTIPVPEYEAQDGTKIRAFFAEDAGWTDDFMFGLLCEKYNVPMYVHGGVICDHIDHSGKVYCVEDAKVAVA